LITGASIPSSNIASSPASDLDVILTVTSFDPAGRPSLEPLHQDAVAVAVPEEDSGPGSPDGS